MTKLSSPARKQQRYAAGAEMVLAFAVLFAPRRTQLSAAV